MLSNNYDLLIEAWERIRNEIPAKNRLDVADGLVRVFDEFEVIDRGIMEEDLDAQLLAAVTSYYADADEGDDEEDGDDDEYN